MTLRNRLEGTNSGHGCLYEGGADAYVWKIWWKMHWFAVYMEDVMIVSVFPFSISMQGDVHEGCSKVKSKMMEFGIVDARLK